MVFSETWFPGYLVDVQKFKSCSETLDKIRKELIKQ